MTAKLKFVFVSLMAAGLIFSTNKASSAGDSNEPAKVIVQVTAMGSPIEHAEVSVDNQSDTTGINGNCVFRVAKGYHTVSIIDTHENSESREVCVDAGEIVQVTFDLGAAGCPTSGDHRHELTFSKN